jgi:hypothetical protein
VGDIELDGDAAATLAVDRIAVVTMGWDPYEHEHEGERDLPGPKPSELNDAFVVASCRSQWDCPEPSGHPSQLPRDV